MIENPVETQGVCPVPTWKGKRFCPNKEIFMIFSKGKLIKPFKEHAQLRVGRKRLEMENAEKAVYETGIQLQSQKITFYHADQLTDQTQREKSWLRSE